MKAPKFAALTQQEISDSGLNPFAITLLAEAFADDPQKFGNENFIVLGYAHNNQPVWLILTKTAPVAADFEPPPVNADAPR